VSFPKEFNLCDLTEEEIKIVEEAAR